jgi:hypothetical protein
VGVDLLRFELPYDAVTEQQLCITRVSTVCVVTDHATEKPRWVFVDTDYYEDVCHLNVVVRL